jgi:hypothetical protein
MTIIKHVNLLMKYVLMVKRNIKISVMMIALKKLLNILQELLIA